MFHIVLMDIVYILYGDKHWSNILCSAIPTRLHDLKFKVADLEFLRIFILKFLGTYYFQTFWCMWCVSST